MDAGKYFIRLGKTILLVCLLGHSGADALALSFSGPFGMASDRDGGLLVSAFTPDGGSSVFRLDTSTGNATIIATGFDTASDLAVALDGSIYVNDFLANGGGINQLLRVDPSTGAKSLIVNGGLFPRLGGQLAGIAIAGDGAILSAKYGQILRTDPLSGEQRVIFSGELEFRNLKVAADGTILAAAELQGSLQGLTEILRIDPVSGTATVVSFGDHLNNVKGIAIAPDGNIYATVAGTATSNVIGELAEIIKVDPLTGSQSVFESGGLLTFPIDLEIIGETLFVDDLYATGSPALENTAGNGGIFGFDLSTGAETFRLMGADRAPARVPDTGGTLSLLALAFSGVVWLRRSFSMAKD